VSKMRNIRVHEQTLKKQLVSNEGLFVIFFYHINWSIIITIPFSHPSDNYERLYRNSMNIDKYHMTPILHLDKSRITGGISLNHS